MPLGVLPGRAPGAVLLLSLLGVLLGACETSLLVRTPLGDDAPDVSTPEPATPPGLEEPYELLADAPAVPPEPVAPWSPEGMTGPPAPGPDAWLPGPVGTPAAPANVPGPAPAQPRAPRMAAAGGRPLPVPPLPPPPAWDRSRDRRVRVEADGRLVPVGPDGRPAVRGPAEPAAGARPPRTAGLDDLPSPAEPARPDVPPETAGAPPVEPWLPAPVAPQPAEPVGEATSDDGGLGLPPGGMPPVPVAPTPRTPAPAARIPAAPRPAGSPWLSGAPLPVPGREPPPVADADPGLPPTGNLPAPFGGGAATPRAAPGGTDRPAPAGPSVPEDPWAPADGPAPTPPRERPAPEPWLPGPGTPEPAPGEPVPATPPDPWLPGAAPGAPTAPEPSAPAAPGGIPDPWLPGGSAPGAGEPTPAAPTPPDPWERAGGAASYVGKTAEARAFEHVTRLTDDPGSPGVKGYPPEIVPTVEPGVALTPGRLPAVIVFYDDAMRASDTEAAHILPVLARYGPQIDFVAIDRGSAAAQPAGAQALADMYLDHVPTLVVLDPARKTRLYRSGEFQANELDAVLAAVTAEGSVDARGVGGIDGPPAGLPVPQPDEPAPPADGPPREPGPVFSAPSGYGAREHADRLRSAPGDVRIPGYPTDLLRSAGAERVLERGLRPVVIVFHDDSSKASDLQAADFLPVLVKRAGEIDLVLVDVSTSAQWSPSEKRVVRTYYNFYVPTTVVLAGNRAPVKSWYSRIGAEDLDRAIDEAILK